VYFFDDSIGKILTRVASQELAHAWRRYVTFAAYVVGISGGVRVHHLEQYVNARSTDNVVLDLTPEAWTLDVYRTVIGTLQSLAWMLLVVFVVALLAFVIVRAFELRSPRLDDSYQAE